MDLLGQNLVYWIQLSYAIRIIGDYKKSNILLEKVEQFPQVNTSAIASYHAGGIIELVYFPYFNSTITAWNIILLSCFKISIISALVQVPLDLIDSDCFLQRQRSLSLQKIWQRVDVTGHIQVKVRAAMASCLLFFHPPPTLALNVPSELPLISTFWVFLFKLSSAQRTQEI